MSASDRLAAWRLAIRPATLSVAAAPVLVGTALAQRDGRLRPLLAVAALVGAVLIQIGTNLANDADDFARGADTPARRGPVRVTQRGLLSARQVRAGALLAFGLAALVGAYLIAHAGWPIAVVGVAAIASGLAYTGGPWPFGYHGLGEVFVFAFFGIAAVAGTYYVQAGAVSGTSIAAAIPIGALAAAILVVNNVRDCETDRAAGKRTLAVRFGEGFGRAEYAALVAVAYGVPIALWLAGGAGVWVLLPLLTLARGSGLVRTLRTATDGALFNAALRDTAKLQLAFAALFALGLLR